MNPLLGLGPHIFQIAPLNFQSLTTEVEVKWPAIARFGAAPGRQHTGFGEDPISIKGLMFPHELGGLEELKALKATAKAARPVMMLGWDTTTVANVFGHVVILKVSDDQSRFDTNGQPRKVSFTIDVAPFPDAGITAARFW